mgnify:CR=1 FL=1
MARDRIDLNRFKKIYPLQRRSPYWYTQTVDAYGYSVAFSNSDSQDVVTTDVNTPIVTCSAEGTNANVNVWVHQIVRSAGAGSPWKVTVRSSAPFTGTVKLVLVEATP